MKKSLPVLAMGLALLSLAPTCAPRGDGEGDRLVIGAYSVVREALHDGLLPAFAAHWKQATGRDVKFEESYNGSGAQTRAILAGFDADLALLSLPSDIQKLVDAGLVRADWNAGPERGILTHSLVVIGHRPGNPRGLRDWEDLAQDGLEVVYPDPKTSGGARWNLNAIYGAERLLHGPEAARSLLGHIQANVVTMDASGRQSMATFERGTGDAIVTYENELLLQEKLTGAALPYVIPARTLLIEGPAAIVEASVARHGNRPVAEALLAFLYTAEAQRIFAGYGFRPLDPALETGLNRPALPARLFTMKDLGGWPRINRELYGSGGVWDSIFTHPVAPRRAGARP